MPSPLPPLSVLPSHTHHHTHRPPPPLQATTCERKVRVYDLQANTESHIPEAETLISMSASRDGRFLLVNLASNRQHLWDLGEAPGELRVPAMPCATYKGASVSAGGWPWLPCLRWLGWLAPACSLSRLAGCAIASCPTVLVPALHTGGWLSARSLTRFCGMRVCPSTIIATAAGQAEPLRGALLPGGPGRPVCADGQRGVQGVRASQAHRCAETTRVCGSGEGGCRCGGQAGRLPLPLPLQMC